MEGAEASFGLRALRGNGEFLKGKDERESGS